MKQDKGYNLLLVAVITATFLVLVLSLWESSGEKTAEQAEGAIEMPAIEEAANANNSALVADENESMVCASTSPEGMPQ